MFKKMHLTGKNVVGLEAIGEVTAEDYNSVLLPILDKARSKGDRVRFLYHLGPEFKGYTFGAGWEDFKLGFRHMRSFERCAVVTDVKWVRDAMNMFQSLVPCPLKLFNNSEMEQALEWLNTEDLGLNFHLNEEKGVLLLEVTKSLTVSDFEVMTDKVDHWLAKHKQLKGLVIHAKKFPGWENLGSFISHVGFIMDHHRKIRHLGLCVDGELPELAAQVAKHFVEAKVQSFHYNELDAALNWAATSR